ncbi:MAG: hypothetical protein WC662_00570 [Candidatus Paceibacterota bacterium]|jgi:hypothetical protein
MQKIYIENCFCLTVRRIDKSLSRIRKIGDTSDFERFDIRYDFDPIDEGSAISVTVDGYEPQRIDFDPFETTWGERNYFKCPACETRCTKLFLLPKGHVFRCKKCHNIKYQIFNPNSAQGQLFIRTKKILKLINVQENMTSRIWYKSVYTKRYLRFLNKCMEVGLTDIVKEAKALETLINANSGKIKQT